MIQDKKPPKYPRQRVRDTSVREKKYIKNLFSGRHKSKASAGRDAGFKVAPHTDAVANQISKVLDKIGLSDRKLALRLKQLLDSKAEDNQLKALRMAFELRDSFPANRKVQQLSFNQLNIYQGVDQNVLETRIRRLLARAGAEESEEGLVLSDDTGSGIQRPDGELPQGTVSEDTKPK